MEEVSLLFAIQAEQLLSAGFVEEAIELCSKGIKSYPEYPSAYYLLANAYISKGDLGKALETINKGLELFPTFELLIDIKNEFFSKHIEASKQNTTTNDIQSTETNFSNQQTDTILPQKIREPQSTKSLNKNIFLASDLTIIPGLEFTTITFMESPKSPSSHFTPISDSLFPPYFLPKQNNTSTENNKFEQPQEEGAYPNSPKPTCIDNENLISSSLNSETLAEILISQKAYDEAIEIYEQLLKNEPHKKDTYSQKIESIIKLKQSNQ